MKKINDINYIYIIAETRHHSKTICFLNLWVVCLGRPFSKETSEEKPVSWTVIGWTPQEGQAQASKFKYLNCMYVDVATIDDVLTRPIPLDKEGGVNKWEEGGNLQEKKRGYGREGKGKGERHRGWGKERKQELKLEDESWGAQAGREGGKGRVSEWEGERLRETGREGEGVSIYSALRMFLLFRLSSPAHLDFKLN